MKLLFLDFDGVTASLNVPGFKLSNGTAVHYGFKRRWVDNLNRIIEATKCKIVVSSDWRNYYSFKEMEEILYHYKVFVEPEINIVPLFGYTPNLPSYNAMNLAKGRAEEILNFVKVYRPDKWVAIDDLDLSPWIDPTSCFVKTINGLFKEHVNKTIKLLNEKQ